MPVRRAVVALLFACSAGFGAELRLLKGEPLAGDLVKVNAETLVFKKTGGEEITVPLDQVLTLTLTPGKPATGNYSDVELTDGTVLHCTKVAFKGANLKVSLSGGQEIELPLNLVVSVINEANKQEIQEEWQKRFPRKKRPTDILVIRKEEKPGTVVYNSIEGTFGNIDEAGEKIDFTPLSSDKRQVALDRIHGFIFQRDPDKMPPIACKIHDAAGNTLFASAVEGGPDGLKVTTLAGVKLDYKSDSLSKLDYSKGKLEFLSDLTPSNVVEQMELAKHEPYRKDLNLENHKIRIGNIESNKGLSLHSHTELEYDLKGEYLEFRAAVGIDDELVAGSDFVVVKIVGNDKVLETLTLDPKDKDRRKNVALNIKDVQKLRLIVTRPAGEFHDLGRFATFADARVSK